MSEEPKKGAKLLAFWLFGTVMVVFAAITAYILFIGRMAGAVTIWKAIGTGFPIWGITGVLCIVWYFMYRWWLGRKPDEVSAAAAAPGGPMAEVSPPAEPQVGANPPAEE